MAAEHPEFQSPMAKITALNLHGLKAAAPTTYWGEQFKELDVDPAGVIGAGIPDRWAVIGEVTGAGHAELVSQRASRSPVSKASYTGNNVLATVKTNIAVDNELIVHVPGFDPVTLHTDEAGPQAGPVWEVNIHGRPYRAQRIGSVAASHLTEFLWAANPTKPKREIGIFAAPVSDMGARQLRPEYMLPHVSHRIRGADGTALHVVVDETLRHLQKTQGLTDEQLSRARARANVALAGLRPNTEDYIAALRIMNENGALVADSTGPSARCKVTEVHPATGERGDTVLRALASAGREGWSATTGERGAFLGLGIQPRLQDGQRATIAVGDLIDVAMSGTSNILPKNPNPRSSGKSGAA